MTARILRSATAAALAVPFAALLTVGSATAAQALSCAGPEYFDPAKTHQILRGTITGGGNGDLTVEVQEIWDGPRTPAVVDLTYDKDMTLWYGWSGHGENFSAVSDRPLVMVVDEDGNVGVCSFFSVAAGRDAGLRPAHPKPPAPAEHTEPGPAATPAHELDDAEAQSAGTDRDPEAQSAIPLAPVAGGVALLAAIGGALVWRRRRP